MSVRLAGFLFMVVFLAIIAGGAVLESRLRPDGPEYIRTGEGSDHLHG